MILTLFFNIGIYRFLVWKRCLGVFNPVNLDKSTSSERNMVCEMTDQINI